MKKALLLASLWGTLAASASAQTVPQPPASQRVDTRTQDLDRMMDIRNWQAGPSAGDAASRSNAAAPAPSSEQRAADLQKMMEIRAWQAGPSSGDTAAKSAGSSAPAAPAVNFANPAVQDGLRTEATP